MINNDKSGLQIFDRFQIDFNLPKWRSKKRNPENKDARTMEAMNTVSGIYMRFDRRRGSMISGGSGFLPTPIGIQNSISGSPSGVAVPTQSAGPSLFDRIFHRKKLKRLEEEKIKKMEDAMKAPNFTVEKIIEPTEEISITEFFTGIKGTTEELQLATDRLKNYESAVEHLRKTGQTALLEIMEHQLEVHSAETRLYALGYRKVVTEANIVEFASKAKKGLCLDWIKNFARSIPSKAVDVKMKTDENEIFDNYVILHFDPMKDGKMLTLKERAEEDKDPILFGVIAGSNKLYYLADWIDEYCDLTFDKLVEKIGENAIKANDLTANIQVVTGE